MSTASSGQQATDSLNGKLTFEQDKNRIVGRDEDNLIRLLILADGVNFIMKVAKEGFDALTAADDELIFNSAQNILKVVATSTAVIPATSVGATQSIVVAHGLGYVPAFLAYIATAPYFQLPYSAVNFSGANAGRINTHVFAIADATNITFTTYNTSISPGATGALTIKFYLLRESII